MKNHNPGVAVSEDPLHRAARTKPWEAIRIVELKPASRLGHPQIMPDSSDPGTPLPPAPRAAPKPLAPLISPTRFPEDPFLLGGKETLVGVAQREVPGTRFVVAGALVVIHGWCLWAMYRSESSTAGLVLLVCPLHELLGAVLISWLYLVLRQCAKL